jgi:AcrR family transcriptional regulator
MDGMETPVDDHAAVFRARVTRATQALLADKGLGVSMDDIATASGVGRRSLFRHFASRDALVAEALDRSLAWFGDQLSGQLATQQPLQAWLADLASRVHRIHLTAGRALWQLAAADDDQLPAEIAELNRRRRTYREQWTVSVASHAWRLAGGQGPVPEVVVDTFAVTLSSFATRSMINDLQLSMDRTAAHAGNLLATVINSNLSR